MSKNTIEFAYLLLLNKGVAVNPTYITTITVEGPMEAAPKWRVVIATTDSRQQELHFSTQDEAYRRFDELTGNDQ